MTSIDYARNNTEVQLRIPLEEHLPSGPARQNFQQPRRDLSSLHEFNPRGITGTITIKIMSMTNRTSISGVTLISEERPAPREVPFVENAIALVSQCRIGCASTPPL
jgi:hypothetical protein